VREITGGALQPLSDVKLIPDHSKTRLWALGRPGCSRLTGIDPVPVAPPASGCAGEVRAKKTATPEAARAGILDGGGFIAF